MSEERKRCNPGPIVRAMDFYATDEVKLTFKQNERLGTYCGSCVTLLTIILILLFVIERASLLAGDEDSFISSVKSFRIEQSSINFSKQEHYFAVSAPDPTVGRVNFSHVY